MVKEIEGMDKRSRAKKVDDAFDDPMDRMQGDQPWSNHYEENVEDRTKKSETENSHNVSEDIRALREK